MYLIKNCAKPFVKWAGGKTQLLSQFSRHFPPRIYNEPFTYIEPFVGGGAMLFYMLRAFFASRSINASPDKRGQLTGLLMRNYAGTVGGNDGIFGNLTDGQGWKSARNHLKEAYCAVAEVYNLTTISEFIERIKQEGQTNSRQV